MTRAELHAKANEISKEYLEACRNAKTQKERESAYAEYNAKMTAILAQV